VRITQVLPANTFKLPIFATVEYLKLKATNNNFGYFFNDKFALPYFIGKYLGIKRLKFTEAIISIKGEEENISSQKIFLNEVINLIDKEKIADFVAHPMAHCLFKTVPDKSEFIEWGSYILNLESIKTEQDVIYFFPGKFRNQIKKAIKDGVTVSETNDVKTVHKLINDTFKRQRSPHSPSYDFLSNIKNEMRNNSKFYLAKKGNVAVGSLVILFNEQGAFNLYAGSAIKSYNCMNLLYFNFIKDMIRLNIKKFDLMGARLVYRKDSKFAGIQNFKNGMGGELKKGYMFIYDRSKIKKKIFYIIVYIYLFLTGKKFEGEGVQQINKLINEYKSSQDPDIVVL
jgi:lipid II:glycine glycyltransferase (peptidoglycan interpeptide bridge formation enzyme)